MATQKAPLETSTLADVKDTEPNRLESLDYLSEAEIGDMAKTFGINPGRAKKITLINKIVKAEDEIQAANANESINKFSRRS